MSRTEKEVWRLVGLLGLLVTLLVASAAPLTAATPTAAASRPAPILSLDTGGHMAMVRALLFTPDGRFLVSASDDKTIRIWNIAEGQTERVLRGEIADGPNGKLDALALSPDGTVLAAAGHTAQPGEDLHPIRLYDLGSGEIIGLLDGHHDVVLSLDFSPDGRRLVSGSADDSAIVWDLAARQPVAHLLGHGGDVNTARFVSGGARIATVSDDHSLRIWSATTGRPERILEGHTDVAFALAVSPDGDLLASGGFDRGLRLWRTRDGRPALGPIALDTDIMGLAFTPDGRQIVTGSGNEHPGCRVIDVASGRTRFVYDGHDGIVIAVAVSPDGRIAATAGGSDNQIHLWDLATGKTLKVLSGTGRSIWSVGIARDGGAIAWGTVRTARELNHQGPLDTELRLPDRTRELGGPRPIGDPKRFVGAVEKMGGLTLSHRAGGDLGYFALLDLADKGRAVLTLERNDDSGYTHSAYGFTPDRRILDASGHGTIDLFERSGALLRSFVGHTSDVWGLAVSSDGRLVVSGSDDQTVRLWNVRTGEAIVTVFAGRDGEWVIWTPEGYYAASPGGDSRVGWQINEGRDKAARFVAAAQLKRHFYRPDIVRDAIRLASAAKAVKAASGTDFVLEELLRRRPPVFSVKGLPKDGTARESPLALGLEIAADNDPATAFEVLVNGRQVAKGPIESGGRDGQVLTLQVPLASGDNQVELRLDNAVGRTATPLSLHYQGPEDLERRGTLRILAIGVDDYPFFKQNLRFAGADARAFAQMIAERAGPLHRRTETTLIVKGGDLEPTAANIRKALEGLAAAGPRDTTVLFLAGHGVNDGPDYLFLPGDARFEDGKFPPSSVIRWQDLQAALEATRGRRVMLVDTCHAGNAYNARLVKDAADAAVVVFAATDADTLAQERPALGHGVFTYSLLDGLSGAADKGADRRVEVHELSDFVTAKVKELTDGRQAPVIELSRKADFVIGRL